MKGNGTPMNASDGYATGRHKTEQVLYLLPAENRRTTEMEDVTGGEPWMNLLPRPMDI